MSVELTPELLAAAMGCTPERAAQWAGPLQRACAVARIDTPARLAAFIAQIGHESGSLRYTEEIWGPTPAQLTYEGRKNLGNTQPGDGERFKGRGPIQLTGRDNYRQFTEWMRAEHGDDAPDFEARPELVAQPMYGALAAAFYWATRKLNVLADEGDFEGITRKINGGDNGAADRRRRWEKAKAVLAFADGPGGAVPPAVTAGEIGGDHVAPFIAAALPAIIDVVPKLASMFSSGSVTAERNIKAVETVVSVAKEAIGAVNEQELVERLQGDPAAAAAVRDAVEKNWFEIHQATEKSIAAARDFALAYGKNKDVRTVLGNFTFQEVLTLLFIVISAAGASIVLIGDGYSPEIKGSIITLMLIAGYTGVREFWFGSSPAEQNAAKRGGVSNDA